MQAETRTLVQLFQLDVRYIVPLYQRPYVWSEDRQWGPLWEDISVVADHIVAEGASASSPSHFLGAIVIQQQDNPPGTPQRFMVIDGQQRLTTLQIILRAAAYVATELGAAGEAELLTRLTHNTELLAQGDERFKVWPTNTNQAAFRDVMTHSPSQAAVTDDPDNAIHEAFAFFAAEIQDWIKAGGPDGAAQAERMSALRVAVSDLLKIVSIRLEGPDNAQVIFETLNGRGTPLIALDLLKNTVFLKAAEEGSDTDLLYEDHWRPELDRDYWRDERRRGRLFTKNGDLFLQHWLVVELEGTVPATELFETFKSRVVPAAPPMETFIPRLSSEAKVVRSFDDQPAGSAAQSFFSQLELMDTTTLRPLAILLFCRTGIDVDRRDAALRDLESYLVRRMIAGLTTKNYNNLVANLIPKIKADPDHADEVIRAELLSSKEDTFRWPTDDELREVVRHQRMYRSRRNDRLAMVLWRVEERMRAADQKLEQGLAAPKNLHIEHVMPQTWKTHWALADPQDPEAEARRNAYVHRLGNLTLTTGNLNASLSNGPWNDPDAPNDKRRGLAAHSLLKLNLELRELWPSGFDEAAIDDRGARLVDEIVQIWSHPTGPGS